jgi:hypothetical protein
MFFCVLQFAILQFDESPIPDCTITEHKVLFFCILQLCNYAIDESPGLIRTSGLPIKPKIQCTQPCTTDFPENMGDLTEEMANATAQ